MANLLVSVPIITYNSSKTILETLASVYEQTYKDVELIISDDNSTDGTIDVCRKWVDEFGNRFVNVKILTSDKNTGVSANINRADDACSSEWVKGLAGDDVLLPDCIETFVKYIICNPDTIVVFGKMVGFGRSKEEVEEYMQRCFDYSIFELSASEQYHRLLFKGNCLPAPTLFYNIKRLRKLGVSNDERIPMVEDYPKWLALTKIGIRLILIDKTVVKYRLSDMSLSTSYIPNEKSKVSNSLIYIYYKFEPRFIYFKSPIKKLGEIRKYTYAANTAWGGLGWRILKCVDSCLANLLNFLGFHIKL